MSYPETTMPHFVELHHDSETYAMCFRRTDVASGHSVCHLDVASNWIICQRAADQEPVLESVVWDFLVGYEPGERMATISALGSSIFADAPPPRVLSGWRAKCVPVPFALAIVDSFFRTGNLVLHCQMTDRAGEEVNWAVPIYRDHFKVEDASGYLQERIKCDWRRRN